ncbi:MAG: transcription regulator containing diacylglycerol kinase catalytic domain [Chitinophagaceae bacterium]|nr:transcription regulator containing diacylglycerol kinase catalytic domain [Chitinophagaceae bacterium]
MSRKIFYLINPISGNIKKDAFLDDLKKKTLAQQASYEIIPTNAKGDYQFLRPRIDNEKITDIVIVGGDGTANQVISELRDAPVNFGIIPMGSGNGLAYAAGIPKKFNKAVDTLFTGAARLTDAFYINKSFSCMLSGLGFDAYVAHNFANKAGRGLINYTQQSLLHYFKAHPYQFEILLEDFSFYTEAFFISIANSNQFGNNFKIAPSASLNDGLLDIVIVQKMNKARLPFALLKQIRGNNKLQKIVEEMSNNNVVYFQTPHLKIRNLKLAPLHVDGEPQETEKEFSVTVIKNCFRLIQPA